MSDWDPDFDDDIHPKDSPEEVALNKKVLDWIYSNMDGRAVTQAIVIVETIEPDGDRAVWTIHDNNTTRWSHLGLLHYALEVIDE